MVDHILHVEMAEFQLFTGVTIDTSSVRARRAFIDSNGKPVNPNKQASDADPQSGSIEFLGQLPDILLHGSGNWIKGKNTGGSQQDAHNPAITHPPDQFTPVGLIKKYTPNPSLNGPQGPPQ
jgi:hypothetical protein